MEIGFCFVSDVCLGLMKSLSAPPPFFKEHFLIFLRPSHVEAALQSILKFILAVPTDCTWILPSCEGRIQFIWQIQILEVS